MLILPLSPPKLTTLLSPVTFHSAPSCISKFVVPAPLIEPVKLEEALPKIVEMLPALARTSPLMVAVLPF